MQQNNVYTCKSSNFNQMEFEETSYDSRKLLSTGVNDKQYAKCQMIIHVYIFLFGFGEFFFSNDVSFKKICLKTNFSKKGTKI